MRKICITFIMISIMMVSFALPCGADLNEDITIPMEFYGPPEDINHNGRVDYLDVSSLVSVYGSTVPPVWFRNDINRDYQVNYLDMSKLVTKYGLYWLVP